MESVGLPSRVGENLLSVGLKQKRKRNQVTIT